MALLEVDEISVRFGGIVALDGLSFEIEDGQILGLIGPNGAGKTTMFNVVSRIYDPTGGRLTFDGIDLLDVAPHEIAGTGIARSFQNLALFPSMTLLQNTMTGAHHRGKVGFARAILRFGVGREEKALATDAYAILESLDLHELAFRPAAGLPFGTLKRLELARALASHPKLLLLDEPAAGLTHHEVDELGATIKRIRDQYGLTVLLVEHHMGLVMGISDRVVAMEFGRKISEGLPSEVQGDPRVIEAYLGTPSMTDTGMTNTGMTNTGPPDTGAGVSRPVLNVAGLRAGYGPIEVLHGMDFTVGVGEIVVILGANGAGKTTTMRCVSGMIEREGTVEFEGRDIASAKPDAIVRGGISQVPQGRGTFTDLTVNDNLLAGAYTVKDSYADELEYWYRTFPRLAERRDQKAGSLSGGEQQMLAIARAMMSKPKLLLCDEPSLGLAPIITQELFRILGRLRDELGMSLLIVEQNAGLSLALADRAYVLETGSIVATGTGEELLVDDTIKEAYLGVVT